MGVGVGVGSVFFHVSAGLVLASGALGDRDQPKMSPLPWVGRRRASHHHDTARPQDIVGSPGPVGFEDSYSQEPTLGPSGTRAGGRARWALVTRVC